MLLLALALGLFAFDRFALAPRREAALVAATTETAKAEAGAGKQAAISEKAIAVLPFVNMSADRDNEYFSDGIAEEILNALAQVKDLKVAGRTSSFQFKGRNESLTSIGQALGVANVLEGSVRKQGDKVRITAQRLPPRRGGAHRTCAGDRSDGAQRDALARRALPARQACGWRIANLAKSPTCVATRLRRDASGTTPRTRCSGKWRGTRERRWPSPCSAVTPWNAPAQ